MKVAYHRISSNKHQAMFNSLAVKLSGNSDGTLDEDTFDQLYDHLSSVLSRYGSFTEDASTEADFSGNRYVDMCPVIQTVCSDEVDPKLAVKAALEAIQSSPVPMAASFDLHPHYLLIDHESKVYGTYWRCWMNLDI